MRALSVFLFLTTISPTVDAQGNLLITPRRVVLDGKKKTEILNLANIGTDTATYSISFVEIRMKEDGSFEQITVPDSNQNFASKFVRIFPRSVTLPPNEAQTVKLQIQRLGEMLPGEYRSHLYFRAVPNVTPLGTKKKDTTSLSINLVPIFGITMPVIIQIGESTSSAIITNTSMTKDADQGLMLKMTFNRSGNMSVYGDLQVEHITPEGRVTKVGLAKGIAVYTPNARRNYKMALDENAGVDYHSGKLRITFSDQSIRPKILAQEELPLK